MNDISYKNWYLMNDSAIEKAIGLFIKKTRQQKNKTQKEVADAANISRSTLSLLERGETVTLKTLIQVLRVLEELHVLKRFEFNEPLSPLALAKMQHSVKERVRPYKRKNKKSDW